MNTSTASHPLSALAISENGFIFDPRTGHSFTTNASGLHIVNQIRTGSSETEVVQSLAEAYEMSPNLGADVREFIGQLREFGWLPEESKK
jgi:hypothetical protein